MDVEFAGGAAVEPRLRPKLLAYIAGEGVSLVGRGEGEGEGVVVEAVGEAEREGSAGGVEINAAGAAVVGEGVAVVAAGVAVEEALGVDGLRVEGEGVLVVEGVRDLVRELAAFRVEPKAAVANYADVGCGCRGGGEVAGGAVWGWGVVGEVEGVWVAEMGDGRWLCGGGGGGWLPHLRLIIQVFAWWFSLCS